MVVEKQPTKQAREQIGGKRQRIVIGSHMDQEFTVGSCPIMPRSAAIYAIGIVMALATGVAIALRSIH